MIYFASERPLSPFTLITNPTGIYFALNRNGYIYYTLDGSEPTSASPFTSTGTSLSLSGACTLKYVGVADGGTWAAAEKTEVYTVEVLMPPMPTVTWPAHYDTDYYYGAYFYLVSPTRAKFYYKNDGSIPIPGNSVCANPTYWTTYVGVQWLPGLKVYAEDSWGRRSEVVDVGAAFTQATSAAVVSIDKASGAYEAGTLLTISNDKNSDMVFYTLDGTVPLIDDYGIYLLPRAGSTTFAYTVPLVLESVLDIRVVVWYAGYQLAATALTHYIVDTATSSLRLPRGQETAIPNSTVNMSLMIANDANSMFIADEGGNTHLASDMHIGPTQPLGDKKIWHDTTTMTMKVNNGVEWVASATPVTPNQIKRNFGLFIPVAGPSFIVGEWTDITDVQFWDPQPMLDQEVNGEFIGGEWVDTQGWDEVWLATIGSWVYENDAWTWMYDRVVSAEEYAGMDYWWKGLRFSKVRVFFEVGGGSGTTLRLELYTNEYNDLLYVSDSANDLPAEGSIREIPVSGKEYDVVWPTYGTPGFMSDFGGIDAWAGTGVSKFTKIEILVSEVGG